MREFDIDIECAQNPILRFMIRLWASDVDGFISANYYDRALAKWRVKRQGAGQDPVFVLWECVTRL
jgi:hypothetical protein